MSLGKRLKELREAANVSQTHLAKIAGVSRNAVSQWEADKTQPSTRRLGQIARTLKVSLDQLMSPSAGRRERVIDVALRLFSANGLDGTSDTDLAEEAEISEAEISVLFATREELLHAVTRKYLESTFAEVRRMPPRYGSLLARLKYLLRTLASRDIAHLNLVIAIQAGSWVRSISDEREYGRLLSEFHDTVVDLFDEAVASRQIQPGHFRAASTLIRAAYIGALRRAVFDPVDADKLVTLIEPQLAIVLSGFGYSDAYGFAEDPSEG